MRVVRKKLVSVAVDTLGVFLRSMMVIFIALDPGQFISNSAPALCKV